jgi:hypothetical protein
MSYCVHICSFYFKGLNTVLGLFCEVFICEKSVLNKSFRHPEKPMLSHVCANLTFQSVSMFHLWKYWMVYLWCRNRRAIKQCSNYRGISLLSYSYKILSNILLSRLNPYIDEIIGDHQCGFQCNRTTTDQIFCICQTLEKKWEYSENSHLLSKNIKIRIYRTVILPVVLYGYGTWSLIIRWNIGVWE